MNNTQTIKIYRDGQLSLIETYKPIIARKIRDYISAKSVTYWKQINKAFDPTFEF